MNLIYQIIIRLYGAIIYIASPFSLKARQWLNGRKNLEDYLPDGTTENIIWFHCASLGEYMQAKPLIEALKERHTEHKILLTFFSPSGYLNAGKNEHIDYKAYMPLDTPANAQSFLERTKPKIAIFIKSELWPNFFKKLHHNSIPTYLVSAIFKPQHYLFKFYGKWHLGILKDVSHIFVQDEESKTLLNKKGIHQVTVSGDNRYDKVFEDSIHPKEIPYINSFKGSHPLIVAGSTYKIDSKMLINISNRMPEVKFILAPHEIVLCDDLKKYGLLYSQANKDNVKNHSILIIDSIGILSQLYQYANLSYIGGAFGKGLHNILEAIAFGSYVLFGPKFHKYKEANEAIRVGIAQSIKSEYELETAIKKHINNSSHSKNDALAFISKNKGANKIIINAIKNVI
ncbi:MAG: glycosyltransferase N-terminal domain-containing protein, partial [Bacteroidota bacterium]|nr:glycosyltransferase N-terminal domain-containing protein [Bacteroidota bacterium]